MKIYNQELDLENGEAVEQLWDNFGTILKNFFIVLSLVIISDWSEWVGDRNLLGDIKILPWKCGYHLGIKVAIVSISISKKVSPGGNQALYIRYFLA